MSTPISLSPTTFFCQPSEPDTGLHQARVNLPAPAMPVMRSRSISAPAGPLREYGKGSAPTFSFYSRPHVLVGGPTHHETTTPAPEELTLDESGTEEARMLALLLEVHGARVLAQLSSHQKGLVLVAAARQGYLEAVKHLLRTDTDLGVFDAIGENALLAAARAGQLKTLARLLKAGCSVNCFPLTDKGGDAIDYAIRHGQAQAAAIMALHHNIRVSLVVADTPLRGCKGETPLNISRRGLRHHPARLVDQ